ncbi:MAG: acyl carrier protein [Deltaproteobacteria bacterium]|nr:acyl carrier protein [Deltaproteobacteria bacterium]
MNPEQIKQEVLAALLEVAPEIEIKTLDHEKNFRDQYPLDSIDFLHFILNIEKRLGIKIPETDAPRLSSLNGVIKYLVK